MKNKVYLIGAGPGKPDLITVRGMNILKEADVVIYDYLVNKEILTITKKDAQLFCVDEISKSNNGAKKDQQKLNRFILKKVKEGKKVVRLKNGDPVIFGRLNEELMYLTKEKIDFEIVPSVTSATAAAAYCGISLTDRRKASCCVFVTGTEDSKKKISLIDWRKISDCGTIVVYMGIGNFDKIVKEILKAGKSKRTPVMIIKDATLPTQKVIKGNLENILKKVKKENINPPAIVIIGEVAKSEEEFNWFKKAKKVLFTGLSKERFFRDEFYYHLPLIKIEPLDDYCAFDSLLKKINDFDWIVFTSRYAVEYFFRRLFSLGYDARLFYNIKIAAIGNSTRKKLLEFGIIADLVPKEESSKGLLKRFKKEDLEGKKILLVRSNLSDKGLEEGFKEQKAVPIRGIAYKNIIPPNLADIDFTNFNEIIFTSPSGVRNFKKRYHKVPQDVKINWIGEVTKRELLKQKIL